MSNFANGVTPLVNGLPVDGSNPLPVTPEFDVGPLATSAKQDTLQTAVNLLATSAKQDSLLSAVATSAKQNDILTALDVPILSKLYLDAFGRIPVSNPTYVFDAQFTYNLHSLLFEQKVSGTGASIQHDTTNRCATMAFSSTAGGGYAYMQTYEHFRYQPGRSQHIVLTGNFKGGGSNVLMFLGYSDGQNGVELQMNGTTARVAILSTTAVGNQYVNQSSWDDKLDGTGASGITVDWTKEHIVDIDLQALYVGEVRFRLNIDGKLVQFHTIKNANVQLKPYIATANLPIRAGMTCSGTATASMDFNCCTVMSCGGTPDELGYQFSTEGTVTAANGSRTHILSVRPKTTFNSFTNRIKYVLDSVDLVVTGTNPIKWELCVGQALITPTYADVNSTYSGFEAVSAATLSGSPALVIAEGYVAGGSTSVRQSNKSVTARYPITLDAAGAVRDLGTLTMLVTAYTGTSATRCVFNWREIR